MEFQRLMKATVLIIEDDPGNLADNENFVKEIETGRRGDVGISEFVVEKAESLEKAIKLLSSNIQSPYNIVLLDLFLPEPSTGEHEIGGYVSKNVDTKYRGLKILDFIQKTGAAETVIVVSAFPDDNWLEVFRRGGSDFITKPFEVEELHERVLVSWSRLLLKKSNHILDERITGLVSYAEKGLAHNFSSCFSRLVRAVAHNVEDMEEYMRERYGLDRRKDSQDYFFQLLEMQKGSVDKAKTEWEALQASLLSLGESDRKETVDALLRDIHRSLLPCFIVKNVELEASSAHEMAVLTFEDDVRVVLKEIIVGALNERPNYSTPKESLKINIGHEDGQVKVSFTDFQRPISTGDAEKINQGASILPGLRFTREWGLGVAQHVAMRGGGHIEIKPQSSRGNVVTYFIPSAN
jgi:CheY-like chemotaxis protein